jgi:hypothetical protein
MDKLTLQGQELSGTGPGDAFRIPKQYIKDKVIRKKTKYTLVIIEEEQS